MNLIDGLALLAEKLSLDAEALIDYAAEDSEGGRNAGFSDWSIDPDEGKVLYALVRALRPDQVIEIGVNEGASTRHLLRALESNGRGNLDSYDLEAPTDFGSFPYQTDHWTFHQTDALTVEFPPAELVFEDSAHDLATCTALFIRFQQTARVLVTHDTNMTAEHGNFHVREAFEAIFPDGLLLTLGGCERGLGVWINPHWGSLKTIRK